MTVLLSKRIVGDNIEYFTDGDLTLIGPHLAHASYSGKEYSVSEGGHEVHALVVYFHPDWFTRELLSSSDFIFLQKLLTKMERGLQITGKTRIKIIKDLTQLKNKKGLERLIKLLEILDAVSRSEDFRYLASEGYSNSYAQVDVERLGEVYKFVMKNFTNNIRLQDVSAIANMTTTSFCKYFKVKTGKTFSNFVNELRIGEATKLLYDPNNSIAQICYSCGFNNMTNFNKTFRSFTKMTPTEYKKNMYSIVG